MSRIASLEVDQRGSVAVVHLTGEVDISNSRELSAVLANSVVNEAAGLVLDVSETALLDSSAIHALFDISRRLDRRRQRFAIAAPEGCVIRRLLVLVGLPAVAPLHESVDAAVEFIESNTPPVQDAPRN
ncbi:MAG TPA: STAS domain-containing protein [Actinomycetota bacterium]|nr:STAS domain-containing protein [Actinomycetota bacterium]